MHCRHWSSTKLTFDIWNVAKPGYHLSNESLDSKMDQVEKLQIEKNAIFLSCYLHTQIIGSKLKIYSSESSVCHLISVIVGGQVFFFILINNSFCA